MATRVSRGACGVVLSIVAAVAGYAAPAIAADRYCLWVLLPKVQRLRIELAARSDEGLPPAVIERLGEDGLRTILARCGMEDGDAGMALMARYWMARAKLEVAHVDLRLSGVAPERADGALEVTAPAADRVDLALEIIEQRDELAGPSIRAAIQTLDIVGPPLTEEQRQLLAEYLSAKLIVDGLDAGATPPPETADAADGEGSESAVEGVGGEAGASTATE